MKFQPQGKYQKMTNVLKRKKIVLSKKKKKNGMEIANQKCMAYC
jgi:hypothetical protein